MDDFESSFQKYQSSMTRAVRRTGVPAHHVQDCVQEAARKLAEMNTISYVEPHRVKGLFCKVAENIGRDYVRHQHIEHKIGEEISYERTINQRNNFRKRLREDEISVCVHRALSELSDLDSYLGWKYFGMQMSLREISEDLVRDKGIKWNYVKIHRHIKKNIKSQLKAKLLKYGAQDLL